MIALLRSTDGNPDSRFEKYVNFLDSESIQYLTICWDRLGQKKESHNQLYYKKKSSYGLKYGNVKSLIGFNWFIFKSLLRRRKEYKVIHAADFDTIIPAVWMKILFRKKIIYDIYDWYIDSRGLFKSKLRYIIKFLEFVNIKLSDMVIICEPEREKQIEFKAKNLRILPNIPNFNEEITSENNSSEKITVAYVGILSSDRGLENLVNLARHNLDVNIKIGGFGPLEHTIREASMRLKNLHFYGKLDYKNALKLMGEADIIYAVYERSNPNHILAAPNKYYEGLYLGKPLITTIGTIVGTKVMKFNTGYAINEKYESLESLLKSINRDELKTISANAKKLWNDKYKFYVNQILRDEY